MRYFIYNSESVNLRNGCSVGASPTEYVVVTPRHHGINSRIQDKDIRAILHGLCMNSTHSQIVFHRGQNVKQHLTPLR